MKLYTLLSPGLFLIVFGWMLVQFCTEPEEPPAPIKIVAPALNTNDTGEQP